MGNKGAFITLKGSDLTPNFTSYDAVPHPNIKPWLMQILSSVCFLSGAPCCRLYISAYVLPTKRFLDCAMTAKDVIGA